jgi:hypothetical protein
MNNLEIVVALAAALAVLATLASLGVVLAADTRTQPIR